MDMPLIKIKFTILNRDGSKHHEGTYNHSDIAERRACSERFNQCLLSGYTVTTRRMDNK